MLAATLTQVDLAAIIHGVAADGVTVSPFGAGATTFHNDPTTAARVDFPLLDAPGKWTATFELYENVLQHHGILLEFLADVAAVIAASTRPTAEEWRNLETVVNLLAFFNQGRYRLM
ncbi:hypothetical protein AMAG_08048 [Allomyces macrogynus ATCC 38327]|uniref:Uncharacterized protein n=1 Tax=Allomyces macrogynus (strain ATCC 38327) TaxID=578462 RepID=A0A0L0SK53_ALLM3|nr:hypothetical protein AMAG_08048 [Allomyces macrogynus ATCC 38327]|eukprot:KNE62871.1 hypothetical protein AMAG_08048 [Allomyces macrogynus ATCC 38327]